MLFKILSPSWLNVVKPVSNGMSSNKITKTCLIPDYALQNLMRAAMLPNADEYFASHFKAKL